MKVRTGYKQTEVGIIPVDWDVEAVGENAEKVGSGVTPTGGERVYKSNGRPFMRSQNVGWGSLLLDDIAFIDDATHAAFPDTEIRAGDVFLNITGASIGRSAVADHRVQFGNVNQHVCIIRGKQSKIIPQYLSYFLLSSAGQRQIDSFQAGGNRQGLNFHQVRSMRLPLPKLAEQLVIATALSDMDALLAGLDRLIAKKRDLKQAVMQQLLTGQTRLPGFREEWVFRRVDQIAPLQRGFDLPNPALRPGPYPVVYSNGILNHHSSWQVEGPGVVTGRSGTIGNVTFVEGMYWPHNTALWVTDFKGNDPKFVFYLYTQIGFEKFATGSGVPTLNRNDVHSFESLMPPTTREQSAIAEVLADLDAELVGVERRREKSRLLKQAMMQELLTGRTRLV